MVFTLPLLPSLRRAGWGDAIPPPPKVFAAAPEACEGSPARVLGEDVDDAGGIVGDRVLRGGFTITGIRVSESPSGENGKEGNSTTWCTVEIEISWRGEESEVPEIVVICVEIVVGETLR